MFEETLQLIDNVTKPANEMSGAVMDLAESVAGVAGVAVIAAAALGGLVYEGAKFALESAAAKQQLVATYDALLGFAGAGDKADAMLSDLSRSLPQTKDQLADWGKQFAAMGVTDLGALQGQLTATASAQALMGDKGAAAYTNLTKKIQESILAHQGLKVSDRQLQSLATTGVNVADVAAKMGMSANQLRNGLAKGTVDAGKFGTALQAALVEKGKKPLETMAMGMTSQIAHLKQNFADMFEDVDASPFLGAMKDLLSVFYQTTPSGKAMTLAIKGFFNGVFSLAGKVLPYLKKFFLDLIIIGLKLYIGLKPTIAAFKQLFAGKGSGDAFGNMLKQISAQVSVLANAVAFNIKMFVGFLTVGKQVYDAISSAFTGIGEIAVKLIDGLVAGITGGVGRVVDAAKGLASGAMGAIKSALGISSPSRVMMRFGGYTAEGFAAGMSQGAPSVTDAAYGMSGAATAGASGATGVGSGGGQAVTFAPGAIVINGAGKDAESITETMISLIFERLALEQGL